MFEFANLRYFGFACQAFRENGAIVGISSVAFDVTELQALAANALGYWQPTVIKRRVATRPEVREAGSPPGPERKLTRLASTGGGIAKAGLAA